MNIENKLTELMSYVAHHGSIAPTVSDKPVGWHIDHSMRVIEQVATRLTQTDPAEYAPPSFNLRRIIILGTGYIPRGKAPAPKSVQSFVDAFSVEELKEMEQRALSSLHKLEPLHDNSYFEHPFFGHLAKKDTSKFLGIHTHHHIKIIKDILKKA